MIAKSGSNLAARYLLACVAWHLPFEIRNPPMRLYNWVANPMYALGPRPAVRLPAVVLELCRNDLVKGNKSESLCLNSEMKSVLQVLTFALAQSRFRVAAAKPK